MVARLDAPQPVFTLPPIEDIPDDADDKPEPGPALVCIDMFSSTLDQVEPLQQRKIGPFDFPALIFGAASFSYQYNSDNHLASLTPVRTIRLALR